MVQIMTTIEILMVILVVLITLPYVSYTAVKLGTYGYLMGREHFNNNNSKDKETKNGD